jgi:hypothetical protein
MDLSHVAFRVGLTLEDGCAIQEWGLALS